VTVDRNPQAALMVDESMVRTLRYQFDAIWPQEKSLFTRYAMPADARILDMGCGTGLAAAQLSRMFRGAAETVGIDLVPQLLAVARAQFADLAPRLRFEEGDGFALRYPDGYFDLVVCRHVTQLVPQPERLLQELRRVLRPGGWLHVLSEDYGMLHFPERNGIDPDPLWNEAVVAYTRSTHTDARIGRRTLPMLQSLGFANTSVQYLTIDTERVPRATLVGIFTAWRDGYVAPLTKASGMSHERVSAMFDAVIDTVGDPLAYGVWQVPVVAGRRAA
jgi:ubiquinone/menaquinone biosynthesis C-methylase UbiE